MENSPNNCFDLTLLLSQNLQSLRSASFAPIDAMQVKQMLEGRLRRRKKMEELSKEYICDQIKRYITNSEKLYWYGRSKRTFYVDYNIIIIIILFAIFVIVMNLCIKEFVIFMLPILIVMFTINIMKRYLDRVNSYYAITSRKIIHVIDVFIEEH